MYLLLGSPEDPCCRDVRLALQERGHPVRTTTNPFVSPSLFTWHLDTGQSASRIAWDAGPSVLDDELSGVLVRGTGWIDPVGWEPDDLAYVQAETQAALLAWLWSLACPVVNRPRPVQWYRPQAPLLAWAALLGRCALAIPETLVSNEEAGTMAFGQRLLGSGVGGAVFGPLTSTARYLVAGDDGWDSLTTLQRYVPVQLTPPHGEPQLACVVGDHVVWEGAPDPEAVSLEPALRHFASEAGLGFLELALAPVEGDLCVVSVEPAPRFERFGEAARREIVDRLVRLLEAPPQPTTPL